MGASFGWSQVSVSVWDYGSGNQKDDLRSFSTCLSGFMVTLTVSSATGISTIMTEKNVELSDLASEKVISVYFSNKGHRFRY